MSTEHPVNTVVDTLEDAARADEICMRDVLEEFGPASFSSLLLVVSLLLVSPLSGVPLFSSLCGVMIALIAVQGAMGRDHVWLPRKIVDLKLTSDRADQVICRIRKLAQLLDRGTASRLAVVVGPPATRVLYTICMLCGAILPLLELVPFSSSMIGVAVSFISVGLLARDGLIALFGLSLLPLAAALPALAYSAIVG
jgi:hypothetical protein